MTAWWDNTEVWITRDGRVLKLEEIEPSHRENLLAWIFRRIERIRDAEGWRWAFEVGAHDGGDAAHDALEREFYFTLESTREEFFESLPLVKRLREIADQEKPLDPTPWTARAGRRRVRRWSRTFYNLNPRPEYRQNREDYA